MAEPTITLAEIRRDICRSLKMPFFRRYSSGFLAATGGSAITLIDSKLTQADQFWRRSWVYRIASQEVAMITDFQASSDTARLEIPITTIAATDTYEIHTLWNAYEIHNAINSAIRAVRRYFRDNVTDESLVVQEDVRAYDISGLTKVPWVVHRVWLEQPASVRRGTVVSATASTLTVENSGILSGVTSNWKVSIYDGTGKGQLRSVSTVSGAQITGLSANWTTTPDATSKYALWDTSEQTYDWYPFDAVRLSSKEFPTYLYFARRPVDFYGMRIRLEYSAYASELTTEASTTVVPLEYLRPAVLSELHSQRIADTKADRDLHFGEWRRFKDEAQEYLLRNSPHMPDSIIFTNQDQMRQPLIDDPLGWNR